MEMSQQNLLPSLQQKKKSYKQIIKALAHKSQNLFQRKKVKISKCLIKNVARLKKQIKNKKSQSSKENQLLHYFFALQDGLEPTTP